MGVKALTADRVWQKLARPLGIAIEVIRQASALRREPPPCRGRGSRALSARPQRCDIGDDVLDLAPVELERRHRP
ncbi:MAG TPA: hypothetical protein VEK12_04125, partial [Alphaproteobacteria bacterium]|nr:hypothetical protein [Alphaproteobacteria bacterium]